MRWRPRYSELELRDAVAASRSLADVLRRLGLRPAGGNHRTLKRHLVHFGISTDHFDPNWALRARRSTTAVPLSAVLVERSSYSRWRLKWRLYDEGLKQRACELCGQGEIWNGRLMSLILDHVNGVADDNRLENLRIVCPNCAATLETHCGRRNRVERLELACEHCGRPFSPKYAAQRFCSQVCGTHSKGSHAPRPETRKVQRPPYEQLCAEVAELGFSAVGRTYGVSDNAVRKWLRWYEADRGGRSGP